MTDLERILPLWRELESAGADYVLATVVAVEGPSYRKPGAFMLIAGDGRRAGTVSGGCLEAQVASRAWWLTANGPTVQRYSTADDDGERPFGSGCGGTVFLLMERSATANPLLAAVERAFELRVPLAVATILDEPQRGRRAFAGLDLQGVVDLHLISDSGEAGHAALQELAVQTLQLRKSRAEEIPVRGIATRAWADYRPARTGLWIFGAGDDAQPLVRMAKELGWFACIADGRLHLATCERVPQ